MKFSPGREVPQMAIVGAMFVAALASWTWAPERIAVHWGTNGPDRYGGKVEGLLVTPLIAAIVWFGTYLIQAALEKKPELSASFLIFRFALLTSYVAGYSVILLSIRGIIAPIGTIVALILVIFGCAFANFVWRAVSAARSFATQSG